MHIYDFNRYKLSKKNGLYGGKAGSKDGIEIEGENWMVKYPKSTSGMKGVEISYTTSPLSEYLGSHVFEILGYSVHQTLLGYRNNKLVVACKDFTDANTALAEIRTVKNHLDPAFLEQSEIDINETGNDHFVDLETLIFCIRNNPILKEVDNIESFFFEQAIVDIFINNCDRNNGNWGILRYNDGSPDVLAPVFDNGGSFQDKISEGKAERLLANREDTIKYACGTQTVYAKEGRLYSPSRFLDLHNEYPLMENAILKVVPLIQKNMDKIHKMIWDVPETAQDIEGRKYYICGKSLKELFCLQIDSRFENLLLPIYEQVVQKYADEIVNEQGSPEHSEQTHQFDNKS